MRNIFIAMLVSLILFSSLEGWSGDMKEINLPKPRPKGNVSVEEAMQKRRSVRSYSSKEVSLGDISQLLWACQGITDERSGHRASPSAGALYPLEIYLVKNDGIFHYLPEKNTLEVISNKNVKSDLTAACHGQTYIEEAAITIIISAVHERITSKYGERGILYANIEAGHAAQNVFLQAVALGLDSVPIGAFNDDSVSKVLGLPKDTKPLYILPIGYKK